MSRWLPGIEKDIGSTAAADQQLKDGRMERHIAYALSRGSQAFGSTDFQNLFCCSATCHTVSVANSLAVMGGSSSGGSPRMTFITANEDREMESRL
jgi:hypothetical protein